ncbi:hypothetical protein L5515_009923 [Caenorhabditis briggsae]|uniref:Protein CBR-PHF-14 n=1 Tax=Caenorhabditis briggsae TaxID=6238 RepID=A0AAE9FCS2_CAEBR|nr:hypothetical protein L5515_009923 [Caenorhabditis briggsae]
MSKPTDSSIFGKMTSRAAGKRQIKPTAVLFATLNENHPSSDEEDKDFEGPKEEEGSGDSGDSSEESNSDEEESEEDEEEDEKDQEQGEPEGEKSIICGVCVNQKKSDEDFLNCRKCGIHVHKNCYKGIVQSSEDVTSGGLWFCEPCQYGYLDPPFCEFCPSRFGAFKKSDLPDRWAHLICALFTHGIVWVDDDSLSGVSWENLENSNFGRRVCSACSDKIEARFGISSRCESGMCKEYMHVTCAQKLGLLVDESGDSEIAVPRYFFCKKHTNLDNLKSFQRRFEGWEKAEAKRITAHRRRKTLDASEDEQRIKMREMLEELLEDENTKQKGGVHGGEKVKQARLLNSSSEFFDRFETKAEDSGLSKKEFRDPFYDIKLTNSSHVPIGFSKEYLDFMHVRDTQIIPEEEEKLRKVRELLAETKAKQEKKSTSKALSDKFRVNEEIIESKQEAIERLHKILAELGDLDLRQSAERSTSGTVAKKAKESYSCVVCKKATEQHKQTQCDQCHNSYHIGCLSPPLTRLPKRNNFGWICHECNESSGDESEVMVPMETSRSSRNRRPPARLSAFLSQ